MTINRERLALRFEQRTGCSSKTAQQKTQQYIWASALQLLRHLSKDAGSRFYIDQTLLQNSLNTVMIQGQRHYVWKTFQSFPERIFNIVETGSNLTERLTMADTNYRMEDILLAAGTPEELAIELYRPYQEAIQRDECDITPIDTRSLGNYIQSNLSNDRDNPRLQKQVDDLDRNLRHAQRIFMLATANSNHLVQVHSPSAFGRKYYQGPNLQNTPKIVRHAALGACHEYDVESSVFAWKLSWFREICRRGDDYIMMPATLEYLDHKQAMRRKLAQAVFDTDADWAVGVIKELITAIGFGAPARAQGYRIENRYQKPALATIITAKTRLDRALADPWLVEFIEEQKRMNQVIVGYGLLTGQESVWRAVPELLDKANRLRPNSVVAYLYQQHERLVLDWAEQFCEDREVLLTVHDCIYTRRPVKLSEFRAGIRGFGEFFNLEHTEHRAWAWVDPVLPTDPFYDPREAVVAKRNQRYDSQQRVDHWSGTGYDGSQEYDPELDPYFETQGDEQ
jgi:hypothetical protein